MNPEPPDRPALPTLLPSPGDGRDSGTRHNPGINLCNRESGTNAGDELASLEGSEESDGANMQTAFEAT